MIEIKENKTAENICADHNTNEAEERIFFSLRNKTEFKYRTEAERLLMLKCEFDRTLDRYQQIAFKMSDSSGSGSGEVESSPGLILDYDERLEFIIISERLTQDRRLEIGVKKQLQTNEQYPIKLICVRPSDIENNTFHKNLDFLYQFALLPACREDFPIVRELLEIYGQLTILQLRRLVENELAIYQLIFHQALRADLANALISDSIIVTASPLIDSIIKSL